MNLNVVQGSVQGAEPTPQMNLVSFLEFYKTVLHYHLDHKLEKLSVSPKLPSRANVALTLKTEPLFRFGIATPDRKKPASTFQGEKPPEAPNASLQNTKIL